MNLKHKTYADPIRRFYVEQGLSLRRISAIMREDYMVRISKNQVLDILRELGIPTDKETACRRTVTCRNCGRPKSVTRSHYAINKSLRGKPHRPWHHYCDEICRTVWLEEHCHNQLVARRLVEYIMNKPLPDQAVCHFVDGDTENVIRHNLRVFVSTERHLQEHREMPKP